VTARRSEVPDWTQRWPRAAHALHRRARHTAERQGRRQAADLVGVTQVIRAHGGDRLTVARRAAFRREFAGSRDHFGRQLRRRGRAGAVLSNRDFVLHVGCPEFE